MLESNLEYRNEEKLHSKFIEAVVLIFLVCLQVANRIRIFFNPY